MARPGREGEIDARRERLNRPASEDEPAKIQNGRLFVLSNGDIGRGRHEWSKGQRSGVMLDQKTWASLLSS